jgi:hypothetical protein
MSSVKDLPYKLALEFVANPHTPVAKNALRHIDVNVWMRIVKQLDPVATIKVCFAHTVLQRKTMKIFTGKLTKRVGRIILCQHAQQYLAFMFERRRVRRDDHSIRKLGIA